MMIINLKITKSIVTALFLFVLSSIFALNADAAPRLYFDPSPVNLPNGVETQVNLKIDTESTSVFSADAILNFPASDITVTSVTNGGFFSDFSFAPTTGKLEIHAFFSSAYDSKSGSGTVAVIKLKGNKDSGAGQISFTCTGSGETTQILRNSDGNNILACSSLTTLTASYGTASGGNNNNGGNNNTGGSTPDPNATNSCGGTCGSNYNCNSGLYCYSGFCRNPDCPNSSTCGCTATAKPTAKATPKTGIKATPQVVTLARYTASPSATPNLTPSPTTEESATTSGESKPFDLKKFGIWAGLALLFFMILSGIASLFKDKNQPPKITPPTTTVVPPTITTTPVEPPLTNYQDTPPAPWQNPPQTPPTPQV